jgi:hypothetical protein
MNRPVSDLTRVLGVQTTPFHCAAAAWFWALPAYLAKRHGARVVAGLADVPRPCEPADVVNAVLRLIRARRLGPQHLETLVEYGALGQPPLRGQRGQDRAARLWEEALDAAETPLRQKGIVA